MKFFLTEYPIASYHKESLKLKYAPRSNSSKEMKCIFSVIGYCYVQYRCGIINQVFSFFF